MKAAIQRVIDALAAEGIVAEPREFAESTHTAAEAAAAIGTSLAQIVKSLIFMAGESPIIVLASGVNRVDVDLVGETIGQPIGRASAEQVRSATGFAIGGVPPVAHATSLATYLDRSLLGFDLLWASAGTPNAVFPITPAELLRVTGAQVIAITPE